MIKVSVPATSANCSVGFDSLGMALEWRSVFTFEKSDHLEITGCDPAFATRDNLVVQAFELTAERYGQKMPDFHLHIETEIPLARGLGSSSACVVGGIEAASAWFDLNLSKKEMLDLAVVLEGHPDNAAPALMGQMVSCAKSQDGRVLFSTMKAADFSALAIIPDYEVSTPMARKALPEMISLHEAASQIGRALIFREAMENGDEALLADCCFDVFHEPYRRKLIPDYEKMEQTARENSLPFWISGSGSTMLMLSTDPEKLEAIREMLQEQYPNFDFRLLSAASKGAVVERV